jgi:hypothetical protein
VPNQDEASLGSTGASHVHTARQVACGDAWEEDEYVFGSAARVCASVFGHNLRLARRITAWASRRSTVEDRVENLGYRTAPHMILYHFNLGFPLLSAASRFEAQSLQVEPRDAVAEPGLGTHATFEAPTPGYAEQVFYHRLAAGDDGFAQVRLANPGLDLALQLRYRQQELPELAQWKQVGQGEYVVGLEPGNCRPEGRAAARARAALVELAPGEGRDYLLEVRLGPAA